MSSSCTIPVIDIFAGPGGLGEGFASLGRENAKPAFEIYLSIEKDATAHQTLELRAFYRAFEWGKVPDDYYRHLQGNTTRSELFSAFPKAAQLAQAEAWCTELGCVDRAEVSGRINQALSNSDEWVLIGGPPCQAYSSVGRSRRKGIRSYVPEDDPRQYLYVEYLKILADHKPAVFVMENVKGLLSARLNNQSVFAKILNDLHSPLEALGLSSSSRKTRYRIYSLEGSSLFDECDPHDFVIKSELHGVPQARHRVILLGVREDLPAAQPGKLPSHQRISAGQVLKDLPRLRSGISDGKDSSEAWLDWLKVVPRLDWFRELRSMGLSIVCDHIEQTVTELRVPVCDRGSEFIDRNPKIRYAKHWFIDKQLKGICNHMTRLHMHSDLHRYLFAAAFAAVTGKSPVLSDFPRKLLPEHQSIAYNTKSESIHFDDRFRVQLETRPSTTITSHLSKDGHYYIHYDPSQCRSLTVREAARLQTFPDNYFFCGNRTAQYQQVGNAVPPLMAKEIAGIVYNILK